MKKNAAELVEAKIKSANWKATPLVLSGNTDCYQPIEKKLEITRSILEVMWKYRHPVGIITKKQLDFAGFGSLKKAVGKQFGSFRHFCILREGRDYIGAEFILRENGQNGV